MSWTDLTAYLVVNEYMIIRCFLDRMYTNIYMYDVHQIYVDQPYQSADRCYIV
jgi:hypothetical protein